MRIISLIQDPEVIRQILKHLGLWKQDAGSRCKEPTKPDHGPVVPACRQTGMRNLMICLHTPACRVRDADRDMHRQAAGPDMMSQPLRFTEEVRRMSIHAFYAPKQARNSSYYPLTLYFEPDKKKGGWRGFRPSIQPDSSILRF